MRNELLESIETLKRLDCPKPKRAAKYVVSWTVRGLPEGSDKLADETDLVIERAFVQRPAAERLLSERIEKGFAATLTQIA